MFAARPAKMSRTESGSGCAARHLRHRCPRISPPCAPMAAGRKGANSRSMLVQRAAADKGQRAVQAGATSRSSAAPQFAPAPCTRSGVRARSSRVPSMSRKQGGVSTHRRHHPGFPIAAARASQNGNEMGFDPMGSKRAAAAMSSLITRLADLCGPGKGAAFHAGIIGDDGHIARQLELHVASELPPPR